MGNSRAGTIQTAAIVITASAVVTSVDWAQLQDLIIGETRFK